MASLRAMQKYLKPSEGMYLGSSEIIKSLKLCLTYNKCSMYLKFGHVILFSCFSVENFFKIDPILFFFSFPIQRRGTNFVISRSLVFLNETKGYRGEVKSLSRVQLFATHGL